MTLALTIILGAIALLCGLVWLFWRLALPAEDLSFSPGWWEDFSAERYLPLCRLLDEADFIFLREQEGYTPALERQLRRRRMAICRSYLKELRQDFLKLQGLGQALLIAGQAKPELQEVLFRQRLRFTRAWWAARLQLELYRFGMVRANFSTLIGTLDVSASQIRPVLSQAA